jgi:guanine deaminase
MTSMLNHIILFGVFLFGAYSQYDAEQTVKAIKVNKTKLERRVKETSTADHEFMTRALELSKLAVTEGHGDPFGSVLVKNGKIIGEGWNRSVLLNDPSAHAEVEAIRDACKKMDRKELAGSVVYASAQPCPMCLSLIYLTGIQKVYYCIPHSKIENFDKSLSVKHIYVELSSPQTKRSIPEEEILPESADEYLKWYTNQ